MKTKARKTVKKQIIPVVDKPSRVLAVVALMINAFLLPGLGTLLGGRTRQGILQLIMFIGGLILGIAATVLVVPALVVSLVLGLFLVFLVMTGAVMMVIGWAWAVISGAILIRKANS